MRVHTIDLQFQNTPGLIAAFLIESGGSLALIETGPASSREHLLSGLRALGFEPQHVRQVFVTHIHLDHAGDAGWWAQQGAQVYCHPNAARHLIDPSRLMESSRRVYGDQMDTLWGDMLPAPADRVTALNDGESVAVGDVSVTAWDTPGHARHHHAFVVGDACFTGDVAGLRLEGSDYLSVTAAPPQFEPPAYIASVDRLLAGNFQRLYLTHFGEITEVEDHLTRYRERIDAVHQNVRRWVNAECMPDEIQHLYREAEHHLATDAGVSAEDWQRHEMSNATAMCADGVRLYVEKNPDPSADTEPAAQA